MALADSGRAIGAVTRLLREHLVRRGFAVSIGKPEDAADTNTSAKLNLFLYETTFDASLRNVSLQHSQPPLWLALKYLLTAFDDGESSDSADAHELLGRGLSALHELNFLTLDAAVTTDVRLALENNPEPLKITFDETSPDLISKIMQGTDEKFRLSTAFQVRPVMIVPNEPPKFSLLVGVDYTAVPPAIIGREGVGLAVLASLGPRLDRVEPSSFEVDDTITVAGEDLHLSNLECSLGAAQLSIVGQKPDRLTVRVEGAQPSDMPEGPIAGGGLISAGEHPLVVKQLMPNRRYRSSNIVVGKLRPIVEAAGLDGAGMLTIDGTLLGTWNDDVIVAALQDGAIVRVFETGLQPPPPPTGPASLGSPWASVPRLSCVTSCQGSSCSSRISTASGTSSISVRPPVRSRRSTFAPPDCGTSTGPCGTSPTGRCAEWATRASSGREL